MDINYLQNIVAKLTLIDPSQHREAEQLKIQTIEAFKQLFPDDKQLLRSIQNLGFAMFHNMPNGYNRDAFLDSKNKLAGVLDAKIEVLKHLPVSKTLHDLEQSNQYQSSIIKQHERTLEEYRIELKKADELLAAAGRTQSKQDTKFQILEVEVQKQVHTVMLKNGAFWSTLIALAGLIFMAGWYAGNTKYDKDKIELSDYSRALKDSLVGYQKGIEYMRQNSDSAHQILGHMPYDEMNLDTMEFRKVQTQIEEAGKVLHLNTTYRR